MQQRVDQLFHDAARDLNDHTDWFGNSSFSSSVKLSDEKDAYVVRMALPDRDLKNVTATIEPNNTLRIVAHQERKEKTASSGSPKDGAADAGYVIGRYEQLLFAARSHRCEQTQNRSHREQPDGDHPEGGVQCAASGKAVEQRRRLGNLARSAFLICGRPRDSFLGPAPCSAPPERSRFG